MEESVLAALDIMSRAGPNTDTPTNIKMAQVKGIIRFAANPLVIEKEVDRCFLFGLCFRTYIVNGNAAL